MKLVIEIAAVPQSKRAITRSKMRIASRRCYLKNKAEINRRARLWAKANPEKRRAAQKAHNERNPDRWKKYCTEEKRINDANWRKNNPEKIKATKKKYRLNHPERVKLARKLAYVGNRESDIQIARAWRIANPDRVKQTRRLYYALYPERVKEAVKRRRAKQLQAKGNHSYQDWLQRLAFFGWRCRYCRCELSASSVTKDHQIPLIRGGSDWASNLVPACKSCNSRKNRKTVQEFICEANHRS